jgi:hypothetical protein
MGATDIALSLSCAMCTAMLADVPPRPIRISRLLQRLAIDAGERISVGELVDRLGDRGFGALMLLLGLPNLVLLPPGTSAIFGIPLILIAGQLAFGRHSVWLPEFVRQRSFERDTFAGIVGRTGPWLRRVERLLAPRLTFMLGDTGTRLIGAASFIVAILISLPIPLANFLGGLSVSAFALGLLQRDGLAAAFGWLCTVVSIAATVLVSGAVWIATRRLWDWLAGL